MKELENLDFNESQCQSIREDISNLLKKSATNLESEEFACSLFFGIETEDDVLSSIESMNDDKKLDNLINRLYSKNKHIKTHKNKEDELYETIKNEFISTMPRKYCIIKNELKSDKKFSSVQQMIDLSPELKDFKYFEDNSFCFYLGYEKKKNRKGERILKKYKEELLVAEEIKLMLNNNLPELYTTKNKDNIDDFSPVIFDFVYQMFLKDVSQKRLYVFDDGTGYGKSYSINKFASEAMKNTSYFEKINHIIYVTDRKNNVDQEYRDFIKENPDMESISLLVLSNEDCILRGLNEFEKFPEELKEDCYESLKFWAEKRKNSNDVDIKLIFDKYELQYRKFLRKKLNEIFKENGITEYANKIKFLESNEKYNCVLKVYPNMLIKSKKVLFVNIDKFYLPIDTIIEKESIVFHQNKEIAKDSIFFIDESDAAAEKILDRTIDDSSKTEIDLVEKTMLYYHGFKYKKLGAEYYKDENIVSMINSAIENFEEIIEDYHIDCNILFDNFENKNTHWLYAKNNKKIICASKSGSDLKIVPDEEAGNCRLVAKTKDDEDGTDFNVFVERLTSAYAQFLRLIKKIANDVVKKKAKENGEDINQLLAIQRVLTNIQISKDQKSRESIIKDISMISKEEYDDDKIDDFYLNPGSIIRTDIDDDEPDNIKLYSYSLTLTPEKYLKQLLDCGAYIVLSSATGSNKSRFRNFNLDWKYLNEQIFEPSEKAKQLAADYRKEREKYVKDVNLNVRLCLEEGILNKSSALETEIIKKFKSKYTDISPLLKEFENVIIYNNGGNKEDSEYKICEHYKSIICCLNMIDNGSIANLVLLNYNLKDNDNKEYKSEIDYIQRILKRYYKNCVMFSSKSENLYKTIESFKDAVTKDKISFLFTTYQAAEKGFNFRVEIVNGRCVIVAINDSGKEELEKNDKIYVDLTGLYIGDITNIAPSMEGGRERNKSTLKNIYYCNSLYGDNEEAVRKTIEAIFDGIKYPFTEAAKNDDVMKEILNQSICAGIVARIQQAVGRGGRCDNRLKNKYIVINNNIIETLKTKNCKMEEILPNETLEKQSYEVREVIRFIDKKLKEKKESIMLKVDLENSRIVYRKALMQNSDGCPNLLKSLQNNAKKLFITKEEYDALDKDSKKLYIKIEKFLINGYSYDEKGRDDWNNKIVYSLYNSEKNMISYDMLGLQEKEMEILKKYGIRIDKRGCPNGYVLSPRGFDTLRGNIGEALTKDYFKKELHIDLEELPDAIYEKMDLIKEYKDFILAVDAKYYTIKSECYDNIDIFRDKYNEKLLKIKEYYDNKKVIGIMFNDRKNIKDDDMTKYKCTPYELDECNKILTVPNIYNENGEIDAKIVDKIHSFIFSNKEK